MDIIHARCRKILEDDLEMLMHWRMRPDITYYMNSDPRLTMRDQEKWYGQIQEDGKKSLGF